MLTHIAMLLDAPEHSSVALSFVLVIWSPPPLPPRDLDVHVYMLEYLLRTEKQGRNFLPNHIHECLSMM